MSTTKNRYPSWWAYYYLVRNAYFIFGIPCLLFYAFFGTLIVHDSALSQTMDFVFAYRFLLDKLDFANHILKKYSSQ